MGGNLCWSECAFCLENDISMESERDPIGDERRSFDGHVLDVKPKAEVANHVEVERETGVGR